MKETLYKAKRKDNNEWVEGYYVKHKKIQYCFTDEETDDNIEHLIVYDGFADWNMPIDLVMVEVLPKTLCQISSFKDKYGQQISEWDLVESDFKAYQVHLYNGCFFIRNINSPLDYYDLCGIAKFLKRIENLYDKE